MNDMDKPAMWYLALMTAVGVLALILGALA